MTDLEGIEPRLITARELSTYPDHYALGVDGDDMLPFVPNNSTLALAKFEKIAAGNVVVLWRRPERIAADAAQAQVALLAADLPHFLTLPWMQPPDWEVEPQIIVEKTNPPRRFLIPASSVLAIHKAIGLFPGDAEPGGWHPFDTLIPFAAVLS